MLLCIKETLKSHISQSERVWLKLFYSSYYVNKPKTFIFDLFDVDMGTNWRQSILIFFGNPYSNLILKIFLKFLHKLPTMPECVNSYEPP